MSLVRTLGKIAVGVMVAKGVGKMMQNRQQHGGSPPPGSPVGQSGGSGSGGGLGGMLGGLLGGSGASGAGGRTSGGLGDLGALLGGRPGGGTTRAGGAAGGLAGGLGGLLESISGRAERGAGSGSTGNPPGGSFGDLLNSALRGEDSNRPPDQGDEEHAKLLLQAMINAAKADGQIDRNEEQKILGQLGDEVTEADKQFVIAEMQKPLDAQGFAHSVPAGKEEEVYLMSLMAIDLDTPAEARYLDDLRRNLRLSEADANRLHERLDVPTLYR